MRIFKALSLLFALFVYAAIAFCLCCLIPFGLNQRKALIHWMHYFSKTLLQVLDVEYWVESRNHSEHTPGTLFLANHVSYLDVLILASQFPSVFITSVEVKRSPILGLLARLSGAYFVERRNRTTLKKDISEIRELLSSGVHVILFPEGTTSDGSSVLPFKPSLLEAVVNSDIEVRPLCLNYRYCNGESVSAEHREVLFYYGQMNLWKQLSHLLGVSEVLAELIVLPPLEAKYKRCRTVVAQTTRNFISEVFSPVVAMGCLLLILPFQRLAFGFPSTQNQIQRGDLAFQKRNVRSELESALHHYKTARVSSDHFVEASWKYSMALQSFASRFVEDEALKMELFREGAEVAKAATDADPNCGPCEFWTAINMAQYGELKGVFKMLGSLSEIISRLEKAASLEPSHAMAGPYRVLGTIYQTLPGILGGDHEKAQVYFEKAVALVSDEPLNYLAMAKLKASVGEVELAKTLSQKGLSLMENSNISVESRESHQELVELSQ